MRARNTEEVTRQEERLLAERIKGLRTRRGWSLEDLARVATASGFPMTKATVWAIENGRRKAGTSLNQIGALAEAFGLTLFELLEPFNLDAATDRLVQTIAKTETAIHRAVYEELTAMREATRLRLETLAAAKRGQFSISPHARADAALWARLEGRMPKGLPALPDGVVQAISALRKAVAQQALEDEVGASRGQH